MSTTSVVFIPKGSINKIITYLHDRNFDLIPSLDKIILKSYGWPQSGWVDVGQTRLSKGDFYYKITHAKSAMKSVTLIPGETTTMFLRSLSQAFELPLSSLEEAYSSYADHPEGVLFPETYHIPIGIGARHLIYYLVSLSKASHEALSKKIFGEYNPDKWHKYIVIASIIENEAASKEEMPLISSVIYNRLKKDMKLQMDGSLNYGKYSNTKITPKRIKTDTSFYNTYKHKGLPPEPVSTVGRDAIRSAIFPAKSDYIYFVRNKKGLHTFSKTYNEHLKAIAKNR